MRLSNASRVVKKIYDRVQQAYNGEYDESIDAWVNYRTTFFEPAELWEMMDES